MPNVNELTLKWLDALRSGKYKQARERLRSADGASYCCLGVLCDVIDNTRWVAPAAQSASPYYVYLNPNPTINNLDDLEPDTDFDDKVLDSFPPREYLTKVGITPELAKTLAGYNDQGMSFGNIADAIEDALTDAG